MKLHQVSTVALARCALTNSERSAILRTSRSRENQDASRSSPRSSWIDFGDHSHDASGAITGLKRATPAFEPASESSL
jgi:hypothetical protein